jgi:hypothetical protein
MEGSQEYFEPDIARTIPKKVKEESVPWILKRIASIQDFGGNQQARVFLRDGLVADAPPRLLHVVFPKGLVPQA